MRVISRDEEAISKDDVVDFFRGATIVNKGLKIYRDNRFDGRVPRDQWSRFLETADVVTKIPIVASRSVAWIVRMYHDNICAEILIKRIRSNGVGAPCGSSSLI